jgi:rubredoxin
MDRRSFFRCLPASLLAIPAVLKGDPPKVEEEPSPWVEMDCQYQQVRYREAWGSEYDLIPCGTRFKMLRGALPVCPKCGMQQDTSRPGWREAMLGFEVKK